MQHSVSQLGKLIKGVSQADQLLAFAHLAFTEDHLNRLRKEYFVRYERNEVNFDELWDRAYQLSLTNAQMLFGASEDLSFSLQHAWDGWVEVVRTYLDIANIPGDRESLNLALDEFLEMLSEVRAGIIAVSAQSQSARLKFVRLLCTSPL